MTRGGHRKNAGRKPSPSSRRELLQARVHEGRPEAYREAAARDLTTLLARYRAALEAMVYYDDALGDWRYHTNAAQVGDDVSAMLRQIGLPRAALKE